MKMATSSPVIGASVSSPHLGSLMRLMHELEEVCHADTCFTEATPVVQPPLKPSRPPAITTSEIPPIKTETHVIPRRKLATSPRNKKLPGLISCSRPAISFLTHDVDALKNLCVERLRYLYERHPCYSTLRRDNSLDWHIG